MQCVFAGSTDFVLFTTFLVPSNNSINITAVNDSIALEDDDFIILTFTPNNRYLISDVESKGEFVRVTATVRIIDDDSKFYILLFDCILIPKLSQYWVPTLTNHSIQYQRIQVWMLQ